MNGDVSQLYDRLLEVDRALVAAGWPALSGFWKRTLRRWLRSGKRALVARVGRRGGKSLTWCKVAVTFALFSPLALPPGELALVAFLSVDRTEATARLVSIEAMLSALGVPHARRADEIDLPDRPVRFRVVTASVRAVVGFSSVLVICDELARWRDELTGANPAAEIIASISPTMATVPSARLVLSSSPWSTTDHHAARYDRGSDDEQLVTHAPTWIANPTITEAETRALEPDHARWSREFAAVPGDSSSPVCSAAELDACTARGVAQRPPMPGTRYALLCDLGLRRDRSALVVAHRRLDEGPGGAPREVLVVDAVEHIVPRLLRPLSFDDVVARAIALARRYGGARVFHDGHLADAFAPRLRDAGLVAHQLGTSLPDQDRRASALRLALESGGLDVVEHAELRREILQARLVAHASGRFTIEAPSGKHDDLVDAVLLGFDPEASRRMPPADDGTIVRVYGAVRWGEDGIIAQPTRYFRRERDGRLVPREPPVGSADWARHVERMAAIGATTPEIERWRASQGEVGASPEATASFHSAASSANEASAARERQEAGERERTINVPVIR